jgi:hypothetical protein
MPVILFHTDLSYILAFPPQGLTCPHGGGRHGTLGNSYSGSSGKTPN